MLERSHRALRSLMTLAIVVAVWPGIGQSTIRAQASAPLTIVLTGASKPVSAALVVDGRRQPVGISDASGRFTLDMGSLNRGKGKRHEVKVDRTGEDPQLVLVALGEEDPACEAAARTEVPDCLTVGGFAWGEAATLSVNLGAATSAILTESWTRPYRIGINYNQISFNQLDDVACDQALISGLTSCDGDESGVAVGLTIERRISPALWLGFEASRSSYSVGQDYGDMGSARHEVDVMMLNLYGRFNVPLSGPIQPWLSGGMSWFNNSSEVLVDDELIDERSESGPRLTLGLGLDALIGDRFSLRGSAGVQTGGSDDADAHYRYGVGMGFNF